MYLFYIYGYNTFINIGLASIHYVLYLFIPYAGQIAIVFAAVYIR